MSLSYPRPIDSSPNGAPKSGHWQPPSSIPPAPSFNLLSLSGPSHSDSPTTTVSCPSTSQRPSPFRRDWKISQPSAAITAHSLALVHPSSNLSSDLSSHACLVVGASGSDPYHGHEPTPRLASLCFRWVYYAQHIALPCHREYFPVVCGCLLP